MDLVSESKDPSLTGLPADRHERAMAELVGRDLIDSNATGDRRRSVSSKPAAESVCTQTTATVFALCARCADTQSVLVGVATAVSDLCSRHSQSSALGGTQWSSQAEVGGLDLGRWDGALGQDLANVDACWCDLEHRCSDLSLDLSRKMATIEGLREESQRHRKHVDSLREEVAEARRTGEATMTEKERTFAAEVGRLVEEGERWARRNAALEKELGAVRREECRLKATMIDLGMQAGKGQRVGDRKSLSDGACTCMCDVCMHVKCS